MSVRTTMQLAPTCTENHWADRTITETWLLPGHEAILKVLRARGVVSLFNWAAQLDSTQGGAPNFCMQKSLSGLVYFIFNFFWLVNFVHRPPQHYYYAGKKAQRRWLAPLCNTLTPDWASRLEQIVRPTSRTNHFHSRTCPFWPKQVPGLAWLSPEVQGSAEQGETGCSIAWGDPTCLACHLLTSAT